MTDSAKEEKKILHPRNKHRFAYDFAALVRSSPELRDYVQVNAYGNESVDFANPRAVKVLNKALLKHHYAIEHWDIPAGYLCPPIPGRADYLHYLADLLAADHGGQIPQGKGVRVLDVGTGANCVYPIIGHQEYGWTFVGSEVDPLALKSAKNIVAANPSLSKAVSIRQQHHVTQMLKGIIKPGERFDLTMCNPPFHASAEEAASGSSRKLRNLGKQPGVLNFGGKNVELWYKGGEVAFIRNMVEESAQFGTQVKWFTSLVSKSASLSSVYHLINYVGATRVKTVEMAQGQKISRFVAWSFQ